MTHPILVYLIVGLHSHLYGISIKAFMASNGKEFRQMSNQYLSNRTCYIHKYYNSYIVS